MAIARGDSTKVGNFQGTLSNWVMAAKRGPTVPTSLLCGNSVAELEDEVVRPRKELAIERIEEEVLKRATVYFVRNSLSGTRN